MSSSTGSSQVSWLRQSIWIIFLPSGTNGETNPKGWYIELISESISHFCGAYPWSLHQNPTCLFLHSNVYHKCFLLTRFPGLVPDLQDPSISSLQGWIPQHLCNCSHTLWAETFLLHKLQLHLSSVWLLFAHVELIWDHQHKNFSQVCLLLLYHIYFCSSSLAVLCSVQLLQLGDKVLPKM